MNPSNLYILVTALAAALTFPVLTVLALELFRRRARRDQKIDVTIRRGSVELQISASGDFRETTRVLSDLLASVDDTKDVSTTFETRSEAELAFAVVRAYNEVERAARKFVQFINHPDSNKLSRLSIFETQRAIQNADVWSSADSAKFRDLARARNSIVHEDEKFGLSANEVRDLVGSADRLVNLLQDRMRLQRGATP